MSTPSQRNRYPHLVALMAVGLLGLGAAAGAQKSPPEGQGLSPEEQIVISVYKQAGPGVVHITSTALAYDFFFNPVPQRGTGSGFIVDDRGYILTNNHVVERSEERRVGKECRL